MSYHTGSRHESSDSNPDRFSRWPPQTTRYLGLKEDRNQSSNRQGMKRERNGEHSLGEKGDSGEKDAKRMKLAAGPGKVNEPSALHLHMKGLSSKPIPPPRRAGFISDTKVQVETIEGTGGSSGEITSSADSLNITHLQSTLGSSEPTPGLRRKGSRFSLGSVTETLKTLIYRSPSNASSDTPPRPDVDINDLKKQIDEGLAREAKLAIDLSESRNTMRELIQEMESTKMQAYRREDDHRGLQAEHDRLADQLQKADKDIDAQKEQARQLFRTNERLTEELAHSQTASAKSPARISADSTDPFNDCLDQVSETTVKCDGEHSVDGINDAVDNVVMDILEKAMTLAGHCGLSADNNAVPLDNPLLTALAEPSLTEDNRGLLLDALLHQHIICTLHSQFFRDSIALYIDQESMSLETLFTDVTKHETWTVAQRWRALTAASIFRTSPATHWEAPASKLAEQIVEFIACAYRLPDSVFATLASNITSDMVKIYRDAYLLSLIIKRDILSVRMFVTAIPPSMHSSQCPFFDSQRMSSVWPEMGVAPDDVVIGTYHLGLTKLKQEGEFVQLLPVQVITTALVREVGGRR